MTDHVAANLLPPRPPAGPLGGQLPGLMMTGTIFSPLQRAPPPPRPPQKGGWRRGLPLRPAQRHPKTLITAWLTCQRWLQGRTRDPKYLSSPPLLRLALLRPPVRTPPQILR